MDREERRIKPGNEGRERREVREDNDVPERKHREEYKRPEQDSRATKNEQRGEQKRNSHWNPQRASDQQRRDHGKDQGERKHWREHSKFNEMEQDRRLQGHQKQSNPAKEQLSKTFVEDEISKWKQLQDKPMEEPLSWKLKEELQAASNEENDKKIEEENLALEEMDMEELLDKKKAQERKLAEIQRRRQEALEQRKPLERALEEAQGEKAESVRSEEMEGLEDILDGLEVHEGKGEDLQMELSGKPEERKRYDMFEDSSSEESQDGEEVKGREMDFDDEEQYYRARTGEVINEAFKILEVMGKGVYGAVVKAVEIATNKVVAIKVVLSLMIDTA